MCVCKVTSISLQKKQKISKFETIMSYGLNLLIYIIVLKFGHLAYLAVKLIRILQQHIFKYKFPLFREVNKIKMIYNCTDFLSFSLASIPSFSGKMAPEARALMRARAVSERKRRR